MYFDLSALPGRNAYKLMTSTIVPRPIAWVVSQDDQGRNNAAPFSFFGAMSGDPPIVCLGVGSRADGPKDTGANLQAGAGFVINMVSSALLRHMNVTAIDFAPGIDELQAAGLAIAASHKVAPPRIADSPVSMECRVRQLVDVAAHRRIVVAEILAIHVRDDAVLDAQRCYIDTPRLDLVGRMHGGGWYSIQDNLMELPRLTEAAWRDGGPSGN
ncbi:flavin reductase family protein [Bordetella sp. BOR01]|uniref:flavin reductase family protein n=1 Tax=Bordetella sp. BOR01 TaxID=2854779 RepID=UPI001C47362D|nr:flavin reductase family protein [Bordetella sp. BOR01]MBV7486444.1 flavin reductase family protein [Bordetella sp. BOR01]